MRRTETPEGRSVRLLRVGEQVRHVLSELLQRGDVHDDVLQSHLVSVTEVRMSPDLRRRQLPQNQGLTPRQEQRLQRGTPIAQPWASAAGLLAGPIRTTNRIQAAKQVLKEQTQ